MKPLVSIIIPCYNSENVIQKTVQSVLSQTYQPIECLLIDDESTDNTAQISQEIMAENPHVLYFHKKNGGVCSTRNYGLEKSKGEWIQFLDHDDWLAPEKIKFQLTYFQTHAKTRSKNVVLYSDYEVVYQNSTRDEIKREKEIVGNLSNQELLERILSWDFKPNSPLHVDNVLFNKHVLQDTKFDETLKCFEDLELWVRLLQKNIQFVYTPIVGMNYIIHGTNTSSTTGWGFKKSIVYLEYLEAISQLDKKLLKSNVHMELLIKNTMIEGDKLKFNRLVKINQNPVRIFRNRLHIKRSWLLNIVYLLYALRRKL